MVVVRKGSFLGVQGSASIHGYIQSPTVADWGQGGIRTGRSVREGMTDSRQSWSQCVVDRPEGAKTYQPRARSCEPKRG
jgi:hypothetical protein